MNYGVSSRDMDKYLIPDKLRANKALTLLELEFLLQQKYFELKPDDARLFSRYLTEDNSEEYIYFDGEKSQDIEIIKSVMRKAVGRFEAIGKEEEEEIIRSNCEVISKFKLSIIDTIKMLKYSSKERSRNEDKEKENMCTTNDFLSAIKFCDLSLSQRTFELIWLLGFNHSNDINKVIALITHC